jgi:hypothetical protein
MKQWNTYKDFATGKVHRTQGLFVGWTRPTGLLGIPYAIFRRPHSDLIIPEYLLTTQTLQRIEKSTIKNV